MLVQPSWGPAIAPPAPHACPPTLVIWSRKRRCENGPRLEESPHAAPRFAFPIGTMRLLQNRPCIYHPPPSRCLPAVSPPPSKFFLYVYLPDEENVGGAPCAEPSDPSGHSAGSPIKGLARPADYLLTKAGRWSVPDSPRDIHLAVTLSAICNRMRRTQDFGGAPGRIVLRRGLGGRGRRLGLAGQLPGRTQKCRP